MHNAEQRPDFAEINQELQSKVRTVVPNMRRYASDSLSSQIKYRYLF